MKQTGIIRKMRSVQGKPVTYELPLGDELFPVQKALGKILSLKYLGKIHCIRCGRKTRKSFNQGYCYPCFQNAPENSECIIKPELCRAHEGEARDMEWARGHCLQEHVVYLAISSGVKVGVTRKSQVPTRWIDQGAHQALQLARTPNRYTAGLIEVELKQHENDRTDWRKMLKNEYPDDVDLREVKKELVAKLPKELSQYVVKDTRRTAIEFPVLEYPTKVKSVGFDKEAEIAGKLLGIKGQYLIFEGDRVINMRKHQGYEVEAEL
mgnify:CR=1 FL=1